jgi:hypothetical protein
MKENITAASVTEQMIADWKKQHGEIFKLNVEDKVCYLKQPGRKTLSYASATKDTFKFNEIVLKDCWLAGDEEILSSDAYFLAACSKLDGIIAIKEAELVKL